MREIQIDRDSDGKPTRMRFGGDDLAGPFPARAAGEVLRAPFVVAPDETGEFKVWLRHPTVQDQNFGGLAGACIYARPVNGGEFTWLRADGAREFFDRHQAFTARWRSNRARPGVLLPSEAP